ncbi:MAG: CYTH and CHAD domain-containing protein [Actinobacteria bacterium]|nr:CYTH and CHAD domain-containing protein [Actinomycetota bacterium]
MKATAEYERKLEAPAGFQLPPLGGSPLESRVFTSVYYDVPGGSLAAAGITLRRRTERGASVWQLKLPSDDSRLELEAPGPPSGPPEEMLRLLRAHLRHGKLEKVAELRTRRRGELVARRGSTAEVTVDEVAIMDARRVRDEFVEVEIELREGSPKRLDGIADELAEAGATPGAGIPKVFRALGLDGAAPEPESPFEGLRALLRAQLREILAHDPGTRLGRDPESLHDMRVAVRRTRALLRAGGELIATDTTALAERLKALGQVLGDVRDLDVLIDHLSAEAAKLGEPDAAHAKALLRALARERTRRRATLMKTLDSDVYLALLDEFARTVDTLAPAETDATLDDLAAKALKKLRKAVDALPDDPHDDELHHVRKIGKRARYASELAGHDSVVAAAKKLQDVLGDHQDSVVAEERLRTLAAKGTPEQAVAAGRLVERERGRKARARADWAGAWKRVRKAA